MRSEAKRHFVYIIESADGKWYYVGYSADVARRLEYHNRGASRSTRGRGPWMVVYVEGYVKKGDALKREREIKRMKSRKYIRGLIEKTNNVGA